ncbi:37S ribosomal protein S24, mitochondrial [Vanrija albida]|uniref:37S ribosomal protein S24, mitochondrial n=1 Tax=Vanrija albida TaxID=181172 RepID=A0ABR3QD25_9TREE
MSLLPRLRALPLARTFATTSAAAADKATAQTPASADSVWSNKNIAAFQFDDTTSIGHRRLLEMDAQRELFSKLELDREALLAQARKFRKPKGTIRVTSTVDLSDPDSPYHQKAVLVAPVSALPLKTPEAIHRLKLLAGPRWSPGQPGRAELGPNAAGALAPGAEDKLGKDGWVKIAEERLPLGRMNRKSVSDMLDKLVEAANDPKSPLPANTPLDPRHLLARQRKKRQRAGQHVFARAEALKRRPEVVGGVRGFPKEWLPATSA